MTLWWMPHSSFSLGDIAEDLVSAGVNLKASKERDYIWGLLRSDCVISL